MSENKVETSQKVQVVKKKKLSKRTIGLIGLGAAAIVVAAVVPPLCVKQCHSVWNEYFAEPSEDILTRKIEYLNSSISYSLDLKEDIPLDSNLNITIVEHDTNNPIYIDVVPGSVKYLRSKKLVFDLMMKIKDETSMNDVESYVSNFDISVECKSELPSHEIYWTTTLTNFQVLLEREIPLEKMVTCPDPTSTFLIYGSETGEATMIMSGFSTNINPSFLDIKFTTTYTQTKAKYSAKIINIHGTNFDVEINVSEIDTETDESFDFRFLFNDKMDPAWEKYSPSYSLRTRYGYHIDLDEKAQLEKTVELDDTKTFKQTVDFGLFHTNIYGPKVEVIDPKVSLGEIEYGNIRTEFLQDDPTSFNVKIDFDNIIKNTEKSFEFVLSFKQKGTTQWISDEFKFKINFKYDQWCGREAYYQIGTEKPHWFSSLRDSNICLDSSTSFNNALPPIKDDEGAEIARSAFNVPLVLSDKLKTIPTGFLKGCTSFNNDITLPNETTSIQTNFLEDCESFNSQIIFNGELENIGENFLINCTSFNLPLDLPNSVTAIGSCFLKGCKTFNQTIRLGEKISSIATEFMSGCLVFNQILLLPNSLRSIGPNFLAGCQQFNHDLKLPNSLKRVDAGFLHNANSMCSDIDLQNLEANVFVESDLTLSSESSTSALYQTGVNIDGLHKRDFCNRFKPSSTVNYRKTIVRPITVEYLARKLVDGVYNIDLDWSADNTSDTLDVTLYDFKSNVINNLEFTFEGPTWFEPSLKMSDNKLGIHIAINDKQKAIAEPFNVKFVFYDKEDTQTKVNLNFKFTVTNDFWKGKHAYAIGPNGKKIWFSTLEGSGLCASDQTWISGTDEDGAQYSTPREEFNLPIVLNPSLTTLLDNFLRGCTSFNQELYLPFNLEQIASGFLCGCETFNQNLVIPSTVKLIKADSFMYGINSMTSIVNFQNLSSDVMLNPVGSNAFSTIKFDCPAISNGIKITGFDDEIIFDILRIFPNNVVKSDQPTNYRNLVYYKV